MIYMIYKWKAGRVFFWCGLSLGLLCLSTPARAQSLFTEIAVEAGVYFVHDGLLVDDWDTIGAGAAWLDFDRDGDLDLYVTRRQSANLLFQNDGTGHFTDVAALYGVEDAMHDGSGVAVADFNNDDWPDLYLANADEDVLFRNDGGTGFTDITATAFAGAVYSARGMSASWGDYDGDGFLDLYVANHMSLAGVDSHLDHSDRLFHNNGDETFTEVSELLGMADLNGYAFITGWTDFDYDGDLDLFVINDCILGQDPDALPNKLFRNDGGIDWQNWLFTEVGAEVGADQCENGMGLATGDYNHDGTLDYFFTNNYEPVLLKNLDGSFSDATAEAGVNQRNVPGTGEHRQTWGTNFADFNLDGWTDLFIAAGSLHPPVALNPQPNLLYLNNGDGTFNDISSGSGIDDDERGRTSIHADYDGDGDVDLFLVNYGGPSRLFRNDNSNSNHWLIVELEGRVSNRDGVGAKVKVQTLDGLEQVNELHSGSSLGGGDDLALYFGLGQSAIVEDLSVEWPSGIVQSISYGGANQRLKIVESGVRVAVTPSEWPVEISASGGSLTYTVSVGNYTGEVQTVDVWTLLTGPNNITLTRGPVPRTLDPDEELSLTITQNVPASAPSGAYTLAGYAGAFPTGDQTDQFAFTKAAGKAGGTAVDDWNATFDGAQVDASGEDQPRTFTLSQNYPNPFNPTTSIAYEVPAPGRVTVAVFDVLGRRVRTLAQGPHEAGSYRVAWDGRDERGAPVASGVYLYRMTADAFVKTRAMMLLK